MNIFLCAENNCHSMSVAKKKNKYVQQSILDSTLEDQYTAHSVQKDDKKMLKDCGKRLA